MDEDNTKPFRTGKINAENAEDADLAAFDAPLHEKPADSSASDHFVNRIINTLLKAPAGAFFCALCFFVLSVSLGNTFLHDEGLITFDLARSFMREPLSFLFFHKGKAPLILLYALPASSGLHYYLMAHGLVCAAGIYLICGAARHLQLQYPNMAGWMMGTSVTYAVTSSNGMPNADGSAFTALFLYLYFSNKRIGAALILGILPFIRYELAVVVMLFLGYEIMKWIRGLIHAGKPRASVSHQWFILLCICPALLYFAAGAIYHSDLSWFFTLAVQPQNLPHEMRAWNIPNPHDTYKFLLLSFSMNSPFLLVFAIPGFISAFLRRNPGILIVSVLAFLLYGILTFFQLTHFQPVDLNPRVHAVGLPFLAILTAAGFSALKDLSASRCACETAINRFKGTGIFSMVSVLLIILSVVTQIAFLSGPAAELDHLNQHRKVHELVDKLRDEGIYKSQVMYSDIYIIPHDSCAGIKEAYVLANDSIIWELKTGTTDKRGQREAVFRAMNRAGLLTDPSAHSVRCDAVYVIENHSRTAAWRRAITGEEISVRDTEDECGEVSIVQIGKYLVFWWPEMRSL